MLDQFTTSAMTALVALVAGGTFIIETLFRRDDKVGRVWSVSFLAGIATTLAYAAWAAGVGGYLAIAAGNMLFVASMGGMWLGVRRFNDRRLTIPVVMVAASCSIVAGAVIVEGAAGGDWAGWTAMGVSLIVFPALAAAETFRPPIRSIRTAWPLGAVFALVAVYYVVRTAVFVGSGPDSEVFQSYLSTNVTSVLTIILTIVAVVVSSVLRATQTDLRTFAWMARGGVTPDGIYVSPAFMGALDDIAERARWRGDLLAVIAIRVEDLPQIAVAFGPDVVGDIVERLRTGVRRHAPASAPVGEDGSGGLLVAAPSAHAADARRQAAVIYRGVFDVLVGVSGAVVPVVGVGVAVSSDVGYRPRDLVRHARAAASRAASNPDASILLAGGGFDDAP